MAAELHLPDLPEVPVAIGQPEPELEAALRRQPLAARLRFALSSYFPLVVLGLLAAGTWWLARHAPKPAGESRPPALRQEPDYTAQRVLLQRFDAAGRLAVQIEGDQVRHYPATDTLEVDTVRLATTGVDGRRTLATAKQAMAAGDNSRYSLEGGARVVSTGADGQAVEMEGEHLLVLAPERRVRADRPVVVRQGGSVLHADAMEFDERTQQVTLHGSVRAQLLPGALRPAPVAQPASAAPQR